MIRGAVLLLGILLSPPPPEAVRAAVRAIREDPSYQRSLPAPRAEPPDRAGTEGDDDAFRPRPGPDGDDSGGTARTRRPRHSRRGPAGDPRDAPGYSPPGSIVLPDLVKAILWVLVAVVVAAGLVVLLRAFLGRARDRKEVAAGRPPGPDPARPVPAVAFDDADRLASEGRFAEAIHVLLLRTLAALASQGGGLAASLTSREVVRDATLTGDARSALAGLVESVEVSRFGAVVPDAAEYAASRARFERLAAARPAPAGAA